MAVTITKTETPQYSEVNGHLSGCIGGGSDYRSIDGGSSLLYGDYLICKGWFGENLSDACKLVSVKLINSQFRVRTTLDSWTALSCSVRLRLLEVRGTVSGTKMSNISGGARTETKNVTINESNNWQTVNNFENDLQQAFVANQRYLALKLDFNSSNISTVRCYVRNLQFEITRTRACYITFKGDGVTEKKTMYDYGASVSFGGTPTRAGYRFKGWSNGSTTYTGALPTAGEVDVTYTAV